MLTSQKGKRRKNKLGIFICIAMLLAVVHVAAEETVIFKGPRSLKGAAAEIKMISPIAGFIYDPSGKTDPFKPFLKERVSPEELGGPVKTILETYDLSQLELIAILVGPRGNWAMVRDSKGVGHVIKRGTLIGNKGGVVDKITEKEVVIKEEFKDFRGNKQYREVIKKTPSPIS